MNEPQLSIPAFHTETSPKPHTVYEVSIRLPLRGYSLNKRYSDFLQLHQDLTASVGSAPPFNLPPKTYFKSTVSNPEFAEERRRSLEEYISCVHKASDSRWRQSPPWRQFLNLPSSNPRLVASAAPLSSDPAQSSPSDPAIWLDNYREMKGYLQNARTDISRGDQTQSPTEQFEASSAAKRALVRASTLLDALDRGLRTSSLGEGEMRRRKDLLSSGQKEREFLEALTEVTRSKSSPIRDTGLPGAFTNTKGSASVSSQARPTGRILGAPMVETERTRELDNSGLVQLQQEIMQSQNQGLEALLQAVGRQKQMGLQIGQELDDQADLLDELGLDVDRVDNKIRVVRKRMKKIT